MKLVRGGVHGAGRAAILDATGRVRDLSAVVPDLAGAVMRVAVDQLGEQRSSVIAAVQADRLAHG